jgi:hypothetical protein
METKEHLDQTAGENTNQSENSTSQEMNQSTPEKSEENVNKEEIANEATEVEKTETTSTDSTNDDQELNEVAAAALSSVQDDHEDLMEDDNQGDEEVQEYSEEDLENMSREDIVVAIEDTVRIDNVTKIRNNVSLLRVAFNNLTNELREKAKADFIEAGGEEDNFHYEKDNLDVRFGGAFGIYKEKRTKYQEEQEKVKEENLVKKNEILEELKELINSNEPLKATYDKFNELQEKWKSVGMIPKAEVNNLWQNYHFLVDKFFDKVKISKELKDMGLKKNLEAKVTLCEAAEGLMATESIADSFKELQELHKKWKEIGPVPHAQKDEIWDRFKAATDKVNQRRRDHYNQLRDGLQANYDAKEKLCEAAEEILKDKNENVKDWQAGTDKMQNLLNEWKKIGPAPKKVNDEIWARFKASLDTFFGSKKEFFASLKDQQLQNYNKKVELCEKAEEMKESNQWKDTTRALIKLQEEWKKIGPVPKKHSDKIWKRFRAACDFFFNAKEEYFKDIHKHEDENLKKKKELIEEIKAFELSEDRNADLDKLKEFQGQWNDIGHVPFSEKDKLMNQYREILDEKYGKLKVSSMEKNTMNFKSKFEGVKGSADGGRMINREKNVIVNRIKKMEDDIKLWENNIGFLASSKNADILKVEFERKIKKAKDDMKLLKQKLRILDNIDNE